MAAAAALALGALGGAWELTASAGANRSGAQHLEAEVRRRVADDARQVEALARIVAGETALVARATTSRDQLSPLFQRVQDLVGPVASARTSATVYVPSGPKGEYRVLAWTDGPAQDLYRNRLSGPAALFLVPGALGPQLVALQPIVADGRRIGVAARPRRRCRAPAASTAPSAVHQMETSFGRVSLIPHYAGAGESARSSDAFVIAAPDGTPLLEIQYSIAEIAARRAELRRPRDRDCGAAADWALLLATGPLLDRRRRTRDWRKWLPGLGHGAGRGRRTGALFALGRMVRLPTAAESCVLALAGLALAAVVGGASWWHRWPRRSTATERVQFAVEHVVLGGLLATMVVGTGATAARPHHRGDARQLAVSIVSNRKRRTAAARRVAGVAGGDRVGDRQRACLCRRPLAPDAAAAVSGDGGRRLLARPDCGARARAGHRPPRAGSRLVIAVASSLFALLAGVLRHLYRHTRRRRCGCC
jgi:hypothetical protein